jgi:hypothetical protein
VAVFLRTWRGAEVLPAGSPLVGDRDFALSSVVRSARQHNCEVPLRITGERARKLAGQFLPPAGSERRLQWRPSRDDRRAHPELPEMVEKELCRPSPVTIWCAALRMAAAGQANPEPRRLSFSRVRAAIVTALPRLAAIAGAAEWEAGYRKAPGWAARSKLPNRTRRRSYPREVWDKGGAFPRRKCRGPGSADDEKGGSKRHWASGCLPRGDRFLLSCLRVPAGGRRLNRPATAGGLMGVMDRGFGFV